MQPIPTPMPTTAPRTMRSLRRTYALWVSAALALPLALWLALDLHRENQDILASRVEVLQAMGDLLATHLRDTPDDETTQRWLEGFSREHPEMDVVMLDANQNVRYATTTAWVGRRWERGSDEEEISMVIRGEVQSPWELDYHDNVPVLEITVGLPERPDGVAAIHVAEPQKTLEAQIAAARAWLLAFAAMLLAVLALSVMFFTDRLILRRLWKLEQRVLQTEWMESAVPLDPRGDELDALTAAMEAMLAMIAEKTTSLERTVAQREALLARVEGFNAELSREVESARAEIVAMQAERVKRERLAAMGELSGALAHEIRNPLHIIRGTAELARRKHPEAAPALTDIVDEVERVNVMVTRLLQFTRPLELRIEAISLLGWLRRVVRDAGLAIPVEFLAPEDLEVHGDPLLLTGVLTNLLRNAAEAGATRIWLLEEGDAGGWSVRVRDDGEGIAEEDLTMVFRPFFTRKEAGTGLGLAFVRRVLDAHGGTIAVESQVGVGTSVRWVIPAG